MLLLVFLFNIGGYYVIFLGLTQHAKKNLLHRLDASEYLDEQAIVLSLPINMPYPLFGGDYERLRGSFEYRGEYYALVKQKLENDTLFVVCIKDVRQKHIAVTLSDYARIANDQSGASRQAFSFLAKLVKDFTATVNIITVSTPYISQTRPSPDGAVHRVITRGHAIETPPPEPFMV